VILLEAGTTIGGAAATFELAPGFRGPVFSHSLGPVSRDVIKRCGSTVRGQCSS
jgi:phytoene dehydrogenase-like protein